MASERKKHTRVIKDRDSVRRERVTEYAPTTRSVLVSRITQLLWLATAIIVGLITLRFVLLLLGANPTNEFVEVILSITDVFVSPFNGIISTPALEGGSVFDTASLFAAVIYVFGAWAIITLFQIIFAATNSSRRVSTVEQHNLED